MTFRDHFSAAAASYAAFRPDYPRALFETLAELAPARDIAWDCATGSGQAALGLARCFDRVIATDASAAQIANAMPHPRVSYAVAAAEASGLPDESMPLITVAQALHWLDRDAFWREARRVLRPGGVIAAWCYGTLDVDPALDPMLQHFYSSTVGPFWPAERRLVERSYRDVEMPFEEVTLPPMHIERDFTLRELGGYLGTWSAVLRYREAIGRDPVEPLVRELAPHWGAADRPRRVRWKLGLRVGRR